MHETPQQYTKRILNYQRGKDPLSVLSSTPKKIAGLLHGVARKRLVTRPAPGKWSAAEILAHLADSELVVGFRIRLILGANRTPIQAFDQDAWADFSRYGKQDPYLSLEAFRVQRERNVRLLKSLPKKIWGHYGIHSERGKETVQRVAEMTAGHDINHLRQVERIARGKGG
jgi:hypothetical protein